MELHALNPIIQASSFEIIGDTRIVRIGRLRIMQDIAILIPKGLSGRKGRPCDIASVTNCSA